MTLADKLQSKEEEHQNTDPAAESGFWFGSSSRVICVGPADGPADEPAAAAAEPVKLKSAWMVGVAPAALAEDR